MGLGPLVCLYCPRLMIFKDGDYICPECGKGDNRLNLFLMQDDALQLLDEHCGTHELTCRKSLDSRTD